LDPDLRIRTKMSRIPNTALPPPPPGLPGTANGEGIGDGERIDVDVLLHVVHGGVEGGLNARRHAGSLVVARRSSKRSCQNLI
jgi:hypothetical protein